MLIYWVVFFILFLFSYVELISARQSLVLLRCVILFIAYAICLLGQKAKKWDGIKILLFYGIIAFLGAYKLTDNLSTAVIILSITVVLIFVVHPKTKPFVTGVIAVGIVGIIGIIFLKYTLAESDNFRMRRIIAWLNPEANADTDSYQFLQGLYAIGSGGFFGKGLGNSTQKLHAIPEAQNDMILAVICEELGVFGAILVLCLFAFMLYRLLFIARNAPDLYGALIATGIFAHIALQVTLNIGVVTGLLPTTGVTLPFISYGGTAIVILLAEMGIALGISSKIRLK
jgi:cell division protein FtsW